MQLCIILKGNGMKSLFFFFFFWPIPGFVLKIKLKDKMRKRIQALAVERFLF